ncbi:hypothetical protein ILUMI_23780 [Ignelater luminosus]|uniref:Transposable element P transposase-like RNase H C-terminal domain-containing protein n=1 Tax=Ignelater luminosus TaxID=2038154 RepID=A0A8K0C7H0_IGNLU|nr:hypothetical protein ILUMI_23780 [Ignelater luminosus]
MVCIQSLKAIINEIVLLQDTHLMYLPIYKLSQDHLELFFCSVRAYGGFNNNPTAMQFKAVLKKLLLVTEIRDSGTENCIALEYVSILHCSSSPSTARAVEIINSHSFSRFDDANPTNATNLEDEDDIYATIPEELTEFSRQIVAYISGFVVRKLFKVLKCKDCLDVLINHENHPAPLIALRDKGGLINTADDIIDI